MPSATDLPLDADGYLTDPSFWTNEIAETLAHAEKINLEPAQWLVILSLREYYLTHQKMPRMREFITLLRTHPGMEKVNSASLHQWFPLSFTLQAAKLAGLPKPKRCL